MLLVLGEEGTKCGVKLLVTRSNSSFQTIVSDRLDRRVLMVDVHVQHSEESIWVAVYTICFDSSAYYWLRQNEIGKFVSAERVRVLLE